MKIAITSNLCSAFDPNWRPKSLFSDTNNESRVTYTLFLTPICDENAIQEQLRSTFGPNWCSKSRFSDKNNESRVTYTLFLTPICDENTIREQPALCF